MPREEPMINVQDIHFRYDPEQPSYAVDGVSLAIHRGEFVAVLGANGCGKSTLAKHFNAILLPEAGTVLVEGMDTRNEDHLYDVRQKVGMVFQNPDNQIVATIVEEDVAFAPENLGVPPEEIRTRIDEAMKLAGIYEKRDAAPYKLSGGQKQRVAIAGVIAMRPDCLVLDESTAMLDPHGRSQVMKTIRQLREAGITIVSITHYMEEAAQADRVLVMSRGRIVMEGTPEQVFSQTERLHSYHLDVPQAAELRDEAQETEEASSAQGETTVQDDAEKDEKPKQEENSEEHGMVYLSEETEEIDQAEEKTDRAEITEQPEESRQDPMRSMKNATQNPVGGQPVMSKSASSAETQTQITAPASAAPCPSRSQNSQTTRTNAAPAPMVSPELENPEVLRYLQETEDLAADPEKLWEELKKSYPKIQPFEYEDGCDILTIRPQDIGKLPRECWIHGNNSFLLHGYYNFRYLILVKLGGNKKKARYLLGVPGHYYSSEKYMATMFGFPNFVLSRRQPVGDGRFGYWYTDLRIR